MGKIKKQSQLLSGLSVNYAVIDFFLWLFPVM